MKLVLINLGKCKYTINNYDVSQDKNFQIYNIIMVLYIILVKWDLKRVGGGESVAK